MILVDTGFWLALANARDTHHARAQRALEKVREPLLTTWPVLTETCHLLLARLGAHSQEMLIASGTKGAYQIFALEQRHLLRAEALMKQYCDLPMDLADASLLIAAEELGSGRILSTDARDFRTYRWKNRKPFENLMKL